MVVATEDFAGAPSDPLTTRTGWSQAGATSDSGKATSGTFQDESTNSNDKSAYWDADTFANNQYSQIEMVVDSAGGSRLGVIVRAGSGNEALLIRYRIDNADFEAYYWDSGGTRNALSGNPHTPSASFLVNDIMRGEIDSSTLTLKIDYGSGFVTETTWDASSGPSAGSPGVYIVEPLTSGTEGDNWEGGDLAAAGFDAAGQVDLPSLITTGVAAIAFDGEGAVVFSSPAISGDANVEYASAGAFNLPSLSLAGFASASVLVADASGELLLPNLLIGGDSDGGGTAITLFSVPFSSEFTTTFTVQ